MSECLPSLLRMYLQVKGSTIVTVHRNAIAITRGMPYCIPVSVISSQWGKVVTNLISQHTYPLFVCYQQSSLSLSSLSKIILSSKFSGSSTINRMKTRLKP
ncbi:hypothetical protein L1987_12364 [Smallanthus sonchifolius]|uniref:Uncharacterized protein n=1 Tax=Smallanthus sonchifolius TaxID=185202 RepID=A0ACB9JEE0_9ASTR|nr:hypothetical protein L1987_12364 [Smallanthus sonchifolius]